MATAEQRKAARQLYKEPMRPIDFNVWEPNPDNLLECYTYNWLPFNLSFMSAFDHVIFKKIADGITFALTLSIIDEVRHMRIDARDLFGNIETKAPKATNIVAPYCARLTRRRYPEIPIGYAEEFPNGRPFITLRSTAHPCSDWLEGK